ncbi:MAG: hypothetical protein KBF75_07440 [Saprospiraceae bacterium]|nr:hypothetical protein [Saprospiraceae bacterium]MCA0334503.1 hypothetical protein [Bacteroidota bacterium]HQU95024.1 hypothetical protein [Saprospiraceae bacterium]HQW96004.1 hypothetical protein [Saprospiraceae bacterium]
MRDNNEYKRMNKVGLRNGFFSFLLVLLLMPIGHAIMVLNEHLLLEYKYQGAIAMGFAGIILLIWGIKKNSKPTLATILGFLGGVLVWTGWVEFSFMWIAEKNNVSHLMVDNEIATKREYLVMMSSLGLLCTFYFFYLFTRSNCTFYIWQQKYLGFREDIKTQVGFKKPFAVSTFIETIMIIWTFYVVLLLVYDEQIAGDRHIATYIVGFGSLLWSLYLISKLVRIQSFDYAIRYAVPTVIIFWNFVEILGRWDLFKEIWVHPMEYKWEVSAFFIILAIILYIFIKNPKFSRKNNRVVYE